MSDVELLSPAGNFSTALAAIESGANAVYCGLSDFSARAFAENLTIDDLRNLLRFAHANNGKVYLAFNTVIDEDELEGAIDQLIWLDEVCPDALIVQDIGIARICRKYFPELELHASTQLVAHNLEGVLALRDMGFKRVVLARELSFEEISSIAKRCGDIELECFIHGALCYSISGLCLFGAMERGRSGNRGKCPYCCRSMYENKNGQKTLAFSMKDLRLGEDVRKLVEAGVSSLKIEGRMKSALYVSSVTRYYRNILDGTKKPPIAVADLETVFSRRTTELYLNGRIPGESPVDPTSLGHLGTEIGIVKHVTKDREGLSWMRFHTTRGLEKHDGLQFETVVDGRHVGMGIVEMRQAISRRSVFEVKAGVDVEVLVPDEIVASLKPGIKIYCSMSNAVKRQFPVPTFRPSDYAGETKLSVKVEILTDKILAFAWLGCRDGSEKLQGQVEVPCVLTKAKNPEKTVMAVEKAFKKLGDTDYCLFKLEVNDPNELFAPMSVLNDLRRALVMRLDELREKLRKDKLARILKECSLPELPIREARKTVKIRPGQRVPAGDWHELIIAIDATENIDDLTGSLNLSHDHCRLALPVYTAEPDFNRLRNIVKRLLRAGFVHWEASDLATLRMLRSLEVVDVTADWTLYAFNSRSLAELSELGVKRFVASPENNRENLQYLAESGYDIEFLTQQSTPLFISLTQPMDQSTMAVYCRNGLWVTTKQVPRIFKVPKGVSTRLDLSWDPT